IRAEDQVTEDQVTRENAMDHPRIDRRGLIAGVAAAGAAAATPAFAQFSIGGSIPGLSGRAADVANLAGKVAGVLANMQFSEADEIALGDGYYERFIDQ